MEERQAEELLNRYLSGECTPEEKKLLDEAFLRVPRLETPPHTAEQYAHWKAEAWLELRKTLTKRSTTGQPRVRKMPALVKYAAAVILLFAGVGLFFIIRQQAMEKPTQTAYKNDVPPGGNRAYLMLSGGRKIDLSAEQSGIIVGNEITYEDGNLIISPEDGQDASLTAYDLQLTTPRGGQYQVTLSDGTKIWLNASSTLKYPSKFGARERIVEISGEGYFSVAKDKNKPFKVISKDQEIEVLGTQFNIAAYADEPEVKTTLVEGSVQVVNLQSNIVNRLKPGNQSIVREASAEVKTVDVSQQIAWKDGLFDFTGMTLPEIMRQLARWYDMEVEYEGPVPQTRYLGQIYRNNNLSQVLKILESANVRFTIEEGRKLIIKYKQ